MDLVSALLTGVRTRDGVLHRSVLRNPFGLCVRERAPLSIVLVLDGFAHIVFDDGETVALRRGIVYLVSTIAPYLLVVAPGSAPRLVVDPTGVRTIDGEPLPPSDDEVRCLVESAGAGEETTTVISGNYSGSDGLGRRLLSSVPRWCGIDLPETTDMVRMLDIELRRATAGRQPVLDRWLDLLLTASLRGWFTDADPRPAWSTAATDPVVGPPLRAVHAEPAAPWTVARLAQVAAVSRSAFAERFTEILGIPPMTYVAELRMDVATDLLLRDRAPLSSVAQAVGYADPFGFSAAYKRIRGHSPAVVRAGAS
ncbi:MAG: AraC family transcriptional regulator [Microbacterium sp.]|uniref:AraC family transcriptional regulator n=1 Tax=Microbacterium sp. TaxID=51671 RepID=UPI003A876EF0